jgi:hypothetical protein
MSPLMRWFTYAILALVALSMLATDLLVAAG